jgi:hypothetical protein
MRGAGAHAADAAGVAAALWFLTSARFDGIAAEGLLTTVAIFVLAASAWRIVRRLRGGDR